MPRARTIKPEFWSSEQVINCSFEARLLFIGLWNFCDDHGIHPASYLKLKVEVFPGESITEGDVREYIIDLIENNLIYEYEINDSKYWIVTGWEKHQKIDKPTYLYPTPTKDDKFWNH